MWKKKKITKTQNHIKPTKKCSKRVLNCFWEKIFFYVRVDLGRGFGLKKLFCVKTPETSLRPLKIVYFEIFIFEFGSPELTLTASHGWQKIKNQNPEKHSNFAFWELKSSKKIKKIFGLGLTLPKTDLLSKKIFFFSKTQNHIKPPEKCSKRVFNGFWEKKKFWVRADQGRGLGKKNFFMRKNTGNIVRTTPIMFIRKIFFLSLDLKVNFFEKIKWP